MQSHEHLAVSTHSYLVSLEVLSLNVEKFADDRET